MRKKPEKAPPGDHEGLGKGDLEADLRQFSNEFGRLMKLLDDASVVGDGLSSYVETIRQHKEATAGKPYLTSRKNPLSSFGVREVLLKSVSPRTGKHLFQIDSVEYVIARSPGELLVELVRNTGESLDRFVQWKSKSELKRRLGISSGNLANRVWRLRKFFEENTNLSRNVVQTDPDHGMRFAVLVKENQAE